MTAQITTFADNVSFQYDSGHPVFKRDPLQRTDEGAIISGDPPKGKSLALQYGLRWIESINQR